MGKWIYIKDISDRNQETHSLTMKDVNLLFIQKIAKCPYCPNIFDDTIFATKCNKCKSQFYNIDGLRPIEFKRDCK